MSTINSVLGRIAAALLLGLAASSAQALIINSFDPAVVYNVNTSVMDATLGITGHTIEDFEDTTYVSDLTVNSPDPITAITSAHPNAIWDGSNVLLTNPDSTSFGPVTFLISGGATSFGIGIGDVESDVEFFVNGISRGLIRDLANWNRTQDNAREVYLLLEADGSDPVISSVSFATDVADAVFFDHLSFEVPASESVPLSGTLGFLALGLLTLLGRARR